MPLAEASWPPENVLDAVKRIKKVKEIRAGAILNRINEDILAYQTVIMERTGKPSIEEWDIRVNIKDIIDSIGTEYYEDNFRDRITDYLVSLGVSDWKHDDDGIMILF